MTRPSSPSLSADVGRRNPSSRSGERIRKPWGAELVLSRGPDSIVKLLQIDPGQRLSLQYHRCKAETLLVLSGQVELTIGETIGQLFTRRLNPGERVHIPARMIHRLAACGATTAEILEVALHLPDAAQTPEDDIVRLADDFGRV